MQQLTKINMCNLPHLAKNFDSKYVKKAKRWDCLIGTICHAFKLVQYKNDTLKAAGLFTTA